MAIDEALLRLVTRPVLRFYRWLEPQALSIGYFDTHHDVPQNRPFVRRYTGGGLVDHEADFTYSIIVPRSHPLAQRGTTGSYQAIHQAITQALQEQGISALLAPCCLEAQSNACFQKPVQYDVIQGTKKLAGGAQRRTREGCLHQGSILADNLNPEQFQKNLLQHLSPLLSETLEPDELSAEESALATSLEETRYSTQAWNYER
jgi:lipoyl(octanoyl) transferase